MTMEANRISSDLEKAAEMLKEYSAKPPEPDCRTCMQYGDCSYDGYHADKCTNADRYEAMRPVKLWRTNGSQPGNPSGISI